MGAPNAESPPPAARGDGFQPFIAASERLREFTVVPLVAGTLLGMVFGASSLYLVLKVGLTVSASIPVAVISITLFRMLARLGLPPANILENNIVQTAGSAGESIAFGIGVTMPAILILGHDLEVVRVTLVGALGGLLGILMMIPLRRALIVKQHGILKYPEGAACAEVLKAGALASPQTGANDNRDPGAARTIFAGFGIGLAYKTAMVALKGWRDIPEKVFGAPLKTGSVSAEISPELLGVGYIIGPRLGAIMCAGGMLAYLVLIPAIKFFGEGAPGPLPPGSIPIRDMGPDDIRGAYILYIGAGAVAAGGLISLFRSLPLIWHGIREGLAMMSPGGGPGARALRTEQDLPFKAVVAGIFALMAAITLAPPLRMNPIGAALIVVFGFLFATVSSRLTGEIGSSSNPISGMTVATLLLTCLAFLVLGWTAPPYYITALSVGGIVCVAVSNAGTTSQDLKTGFLIGATPRLQQIAILIGTLASALVLGPILLRLNSEATVYVPPASVEVLRGRPMALEPAFASQLPALEAGRFGLSVQQVQSALPQAAALRLLEATTDRPVPGYPRLPAGYYLVSPEHRLVSRLSQAFAPGLRAPREALTRKEGLTGPQALSDPNLYWVWHKTDPTNGPPGKYLLDEQGAAVYFVDPGINGVHKTRPDGSQISKFDAPKATLMSYIIQGILSRKLPWALVLLGVLIAVVLEFCGVASLAFAVGVYLPLSSSTPIFVGGMIRWLVDWQRRRHPSGAALSPEERIAESDRSPGVLLASGYIAGGAIAGIAIAFAAGLLDRLSQQVAGWSEVHNPFYGGPFADALSLIPFAGLALGLYLTGRRFASPARQSL